MILRIMKKLFFEIALNLHNQEIRPSNLSQSIENTKKKVRLDERPRSQNSNFFFGFKKISILLINLSQAAYFNDLTL